MFIVVSGLAVGTMVQAPAADDMTATTAAALLSKHAAYAGWRGGDGSMKSLRESGDVTRDGKTLRRLRRIALGAIYRSTATSALGTFEEGFTGRVFWQSHANGFITPGVGEVVKFLATRAQIANEELTALPGTVRGNETVDGVRTTIVRVVAQAGLPVDLYIDPADGALKRYFIDPDGTYAQRTDVLAETDVGNGKRVISVWKHDGNEATFSYTKIEANPEITLQELHPPKATTAWTFGPPADAVPIMVTDKRIFLDAKVNGQPGHFVFDTGAGGIAFTDTFARRVGAKPAGETRNVGIGGGAAAHVYRVDTLAIGSSTLHDSEIFTGIDERMNGEKIDGYIGFDLLAGAIVEVDLDAQTMRILDPATVAPDHRGGVPLQVDLSSGEPRVPMKVGGRAPVLATLDTGNPLHVLFSSQLVTRHHVTFFSPPGSLAAQLEFYGVNGHETDHCGQLESLEVGPIAYRPVPACISNSMSANEVLVGFDFLKAFNYVFDYPDGEILMTPRK